MKLKMVSLHDPQWLQLHDVFNSECLFIIFLHKHIFHTYFCMWRTDRPAADESWVPCLWQRLSSLGFWVRWPGGCIDRWQIVRTNKQLQLTQKSPVHLWQCEEACSSPFQKLSGDSVVCVVQVPMLRKCIALNVTPLTCCVYCQRQDSFILHTSVP